MKRTNHIALFSLLISGASGAQNNKRLVLHQSAALGMSSLQSVLGQKLPLVCRFIKLVLVMLFSFKVNAQSTVDLAQIRSSVKSFIKADSMIAAEKLRHQKHYLGLQQAFIKYRQLADSLEKLPSAALQASRISALRDSMQMEVTAANNYVQEAGVKIQDYEKTILAPEYERIKNGIQQVAKRKGIQTVSEKNNLLYGDPKADISEEVIRELNHEQKPGSKK